jgi:hypothetical protein
VKEIWETHGARRKITQLGTDEGSGGGDDNGDGELHFDGWVVVVVVVVVCCGLDVIRREK